MTIIGDSMLKKTDLLITIFDKSLRVVSGVSLEARPSPSRRIEGGVLSEKERRHSAGLMRVNHVGEVCAQALYEAQGLFAKGDGLKAQFKHAGRDEEDHLVWTAERVRELDSHLSCMNPLWYAGSFMIGAVAAKMGDAINLGFVMETERQVEAHLNSHLASLSLDDVKSRSIVEQMRNDEMEHGEAAKKLGAVEMPLPIKKLMTGMAKVMTTLAYYI